MAIVGVINLVGRAYACDSVRARIVGNQAVFRPVCAYSILLHITAKYC